MVESMDIQEPVQRNDRNKWNIPTPLLIVLGVLALIVALPVAAVVLFLMVLLFGKTVTSGVSDFLSGGFYGFFATLVLLFPMVMMLKHQLTEQRVS